MSTHAVRQLVLAGIQARLAENLAVLGNPREIVQRYEKPAVIARPENLPRLNIIPLMASGDLVTLQNGPVNLHEFPVTILGYYLVREDYDAELPLVLEYADNCIDLFSYDRQAVCGAVATEIYQKTGAYGAGGKTLLWFANTLMLSGQF